MKKLFVIVAAALALWVGGSSPAAAQAAAAVVKVPFAFIAADRVLPAGSYRLEPTTQDWSVVRVTNIDKKSGVRAVLVTTNGVSVADANTGSANLQFVTYSGQRFLRQISVPGREPRQVVVTPSSAQRTLVKLNLMTAEPADVAK